MSEDWNKGVELELHGVGQYRTVKSTEDAANSLLERWPTYEGKAYENALKAVTKSLKDTRNKLLVAKARKAFIDAADDAGIYIRSK